MKAAERDGLLVAQVAAAESLAVELAGVRAQLAVFGRERRERVLPPLKRVPRGRLDGLPGWDYEVPPGSMREELDPVVACRCGSETTLSMRIPMECVGGCGRFFLRTASGVKVKRFNEEAA